MNIQLRLRMGSLGLIVDKPMTWSGHRSGRASEAAGAEGRNAR
jgi:hypothetical protein